MRKNLAKHTAKKLPLAKRVLALCFALIFVCSCLLPAFANGTGAELETPDTEVVEAAAPRRGAGTHGSLRRARGRGGRARGAG